MFDRKTIAAALRTLKTNHGVNSLLADPLSNPKVAKNGKVSVLTAPMHLAPADLSGFNVCPQASQGCKAACLHTAGNPAYMANKERARIARTRAYFQDREAFLIVLVAEIESHVRRAQRKGMIPGVRLNATSDIPWERVQVPGMAMSIIEAFPEVQFYDYTKITKRALAHARGDFPRNYYLTFSATESNAYDVEKVLMKGGSVAMVFATKRGHALPEYHAGTADGAVLFKVADGDIHDYRPADPLGVIVGLRAKGDARGDTSGFVRPV